MLDTTTQLAKVFAADFLTKVDGKLEKALPVTN